MNYPQYVDYNNYRFFRNGKVINIDTNRELTQKVLDGYHYTSLVYKRPGETGTCSKRICVERFLYELFTQDKVSSLDSVVRVNANVDINNYDIKDLKKINKKDRYKYDPYAPNPKKLDETAIEEIKSRYNFESKAKSQYDKKGLSIRDLAEKYSVSPNTIQRVLNGTY